MNRSEETKQIERALAQIERKMHEEETRLAMRVFKRHVEPFLSRRGWFFKAGMGTFAIYNRNGVIVYPTSDDKPFERLVELLETPLNSGYGIGSIMPDYSPDPTRPR